MALAQNRIFTIEDIYNLPEGERAELIDGQIYMMAPPSRRHQEIIGSLYRKIADYIDMKRGACKVYLAPFAVFLNNNNVNYVEPDISIICDKINLTIKDVMELRIGLLKSCLLAVKEWIIILNCLNIELLE